MSEELNKTMFLRRRFCKRVLLVIAALAICFYATVIIFGDLKTPKVMRLTDLSRCPACYGVTICPELYSNQIILEEHPWSNLLFNDKNIYRGYTKSNRKVILKKLAYDKELYSFDANLCNIFNLKDNCKPIELLNVSDIHHRITKAVRHNFSVPTEPKRGLVLCPYPDGIFDLIKPVLDNRNRKNLKLDMINIFTMLSLNPEPIILQLLPKSKGWPVPAYAGVCGRLEVVADEGVPLSTLLDIPWHRKLKIAKQIIDMAMEFTFKHERFRFYFYDWSADNIVVNEKDQPSLIDLEDVIVLDKHISPKKDLPDWYQRYLKENVDPGYQFSVDLNCRHHLSDHNIWSACYVLNGDDNPFLHPIPKEYKNAAFTVMLNQCLKGPDRFHAATLLQRYISDLLSKDESPVR